ncbi:MAG: pilus assembly protein, partial [Candidatus Dormibacteraeota bacterium]|nr:pilus assembly protein [Candidatus Dormibacteraeota bacterium]
MRGIRRRARQQGQSLTEMALLVPILLGFFALTIQGGLVISDQVNLQHYAYEGAQWAVANRTTATTTTITSHIRDHMCGNSNPLNSSSALTRYCRDNTLAITVSTANATASRGGGPPFSLIPIDAMAASSCKAWDLTTNPSGTSVNSPVSVAQGSSTNITVTMAATGSGTSPVVTLTMTGNVPQYLSNGTPQFNPPTVSDGGSATINIAPSINTTKNTTYELKFGGLDQCGGTPSTGTHSVWVRVTDGGGPGTLSLPLDLHLDGVFPLCIPIASPTSLTLHGAGFSAGATVTIGAGASALGTTVTSNT